MTSKTHQNDSPPSKMAFKKGFFSFAQELENSRTRSSRLRCASGLRSNARPLYAGSLGIVCDTSRAWMHVEGKHLLFEQRYTAHRFGGNCECLGMRTSTSNGRLDNAFPELKPSGDAREYLFNEERNLLPAA